MSQKEEELSQRGLVLGGGRYVIGGSECVEAAFRTGLSYDKQGCFCVTGVWRAGNRPDAGVEFARLMRDEHKRQWRFMDFGEIQEPTEDKEVKKNKGRDEEKVLSGTLLYPDG
ncbi:MAG: hypothetical protein JSV99_10935 [Planctomycetota bacterium]|nr:MAG: hypothetical protein JSV99_10935 [Planctomycetota bacterium]